MSPTRERLYANMGDLYTEVPREEDPYAYGNESIYDSICYYQAPVSVAHSVTFPTLTTSPSPHHSR